MTQYYCGDELDKNNLPSYYCEFVWNEASSEWQLVSSSLPGSHCYCTDPASIAASTSSSETFYNYPCCDGSLAFSTSEDVRFGTYRFQRGQFFAVQAVSSGKAGCPMDLLEYSKANPAFSFTQAIEFSAQARGVYRYQQGVFQRIQQEGECPDDLVAYSIDNPDFYFVATVPFD